MAQKPAGQFAMSFQHILFIFMLSVISCTSSNWDSITVSNKCKAESIILTSDGKSKCTLAPGTDKMVFARPGALVRLLKQSNQMQVYEFTMDRHDRSFIIRFQYKLDVFDDYVEGKSTISIKNSPNPEFHK